MNQTGQLFDWGSNQFPHGHCRLHLYWCFHPHHRSLCSDLRTAPVIFPWSEARQRSLPVLSSPFQSLPVVRAHEVHIYEIQAAPKMQQDPLQLWKLTDGERASGMTFWLQATVPAGYPWWLERASGYLDLWWKSPVWRANQCKGMTQRYTKGLGQRMAWKTNRIEVWFMMIHDDQAIGHYVIWVALQVISSPFWWPLPLMRLLAEADPSAVGESAKPLCYSIWTHPDRSDGRHPADGLLAILEMGQLTLGVLGQELCHSLAKSVSDKLERAGNSSNI